MSMSIMSNKRECYLCGTSNDLHKHHIFYGTGKRSLSEKYGCWVFLCARHHNMSDEGVHFNKAFDNELKRQAQERFEITYPDINFLKTFGKNYK